MMELSFDGQRTVARTGPDGRWALFDGGYIYRYKLVIPVAYVQKPFGACLSIGLNPSTADEMKNDPTVRRDIGYAKAWGYSTLVKANLFGYRATDPDALYDAAEHGQDIVGPANNEQLLAMATKADLVVCAWGNHGQLMSRGAAVRHMLSAAGVRLHYLRLTKAGQPGHSLYLPASLRPEPWV